MTKSQQEDTGFDLSEFNDLQSAQEEGLRVDITDPRDPDRELGMYFVITGPDSKRHQAAVRRSLDARIQKRKMKMSAEAIDKESLRHLAARVIQWGGFVDSGKPVELTTDNVISILQRFPFIREQLEERANERGNFTKNSET